MSNDTSELDEILVAFYNQAAQDVADNHLQEGKLFTTAHTRAKQAIADHYAKREQEAERRLLDFAIDVVYQYGYERGDGTYATGGLSTQEEAFRVLRDNGLLDKNGVFNPAELNRTSKDEAHHD